MSKGKILKLEGLPFISYFANALIGYSRFDFNSNYICTKMTFNGKVVIEAKDFNIGLSFRQHPQYLTHFEEDELVYIVFKHNPKFTEDVVRLLCSNFSKISKEFINFLIDTSGLEYKNKTSLGLYTHPILEGLLRLKDFSKLIKDVKFTEGEFLPDIDVWEDIIDIESII